MHPQRFIGLYLSLTNADISTYPQWFRTQEEAELFASSYGLDAKESERSFTVSDRHIAD
jgi:hypothetical protein